MMPDARIDIRTIPRLKSVMTVTRHRSRVSEQVWLGWHNTWNALQVMDFAFQQLGLKVTRGRVQRAVKWAKRAHDKHVDRIRWTGRERAEIPTRIEEDIDMSLENYIAAMEAAMDWKKEPIFAVEAAWRWRDWTDHEGTADEVAAVAAMLSAGQVEFAYAFVKDVMAAYAVERP